MEIIILLITIFISIILFYLIQRLRFKLPPGPRPWPIIGNLLGIRKGLFKSYNDWARTHGPIISVWLGSNLNVVVSNSELAKQVLKEHDYVLADRFRLKINNTSSNGQDLIWADYGPHYVKVRKMCTLELFSAKKIEGLRPVREDEVAAMVDSIYKDFSNNCDDKLGSIIVLRKYLGGVALNTITRIVLGKRFVDSKGDLDELGQEFKAIVAGGRNLVRASFMDEYIPLLRWFSPSRDHKFKMHRDRVNRLTKQIMEEHTKVRLESGEDKEHFVDALLSLKDHYELSNETVVGLLWNLIIAGTDTTAIMVEWAMAELLRNTRVLQKAQEELDHVIGLNRVMTENDISALPYLQAIVKEALRLHPAAPLLMPHKARTHVKIGGYDIPKGTTIHVNAWAIGRDADNWPNPLQFRPERFLELDIDFKGSDFRLLPFGAGRRVCIGAQVGVKLVTTMLGRLLHQFNWCLPEGVKAEDINMLENDSVFVTYMDTPLRVQPIPRLTPHLYKWVPYEM